MMVAGKTDLEVKMGVSSVIVRRIARATPKFLHVSPLMAPVLFAIGVGGLLTEGFGPRLSDYAHYLFLGVSAFIALYSLFLVLLLLERGRSVQG